MSRFSPSLLRYALLGDAFASGATGLLLAAAPLSALLGLPSGLLRPAGLFLLPFAAAVAWIGTRPIIPRGLAGAVAAANALWVLASVALLGWSGLAPTGLGQAFVLLQAAAVAGFAGAQAAGLRRRASAALA